MTMTDCTATKLALALHMLTPREREEVKDVFYELLRLRDLQENPHLGLILGRFDD